MKKGKSIGIMAAFFTWIFLAIFSVVSGELMAQTITLKFSDPSPYGQARTIKYKEWGDWLNKMTGGRVNIEWYWSESLAKAKDNIHATKGGLCDMATNSSWGYHKTLFPIWQFSELLFLGPADWGPHGWACNELYETIPSLKEEIEKAGVKFIAAFGAHSTHFISKRPIRTLKDFKGLRIRAIGPVADWMKAVGASPAGLTVYETYEALQRGTVDATQSYMYINVPYKFHEVTKYCILPGFQNITVSVIMNVSAWNKLPDDIKKILEGEGRRKLIELTIQGYDEDWDKSEKTLREAGIEFIEIPPDEFARWKSSAHDVVTAKWLESMKKMGIDGQSILDKYSNAYKKYERKRR